MEKQIWTIGHSNLFFEEVSFLLNAYEIKVLADVRRYPGSRKYPHFNKDFLEHHLGKIGIRYLHFPDLGGRRKAVPNSRNSAWRNEAFRGYADYMESETFKNELRKVTEIKERTALMYSEVLWWRCHRSLISDFLKSAGYVVTHILTPTKSEEHPYTSVAKIVDGKLTYGSEQLGINF